MEPNYKIAGSDTGFVQEPVQLSNQYDDDHALQDVLRRYLPAHVFQDVEADLHRFGDRVVKDIYAMSESANDPNNYPRLKQYDAWCRRVDEITVSDAWKQLNDVSAEEGLVAIGFERKHNEFSRIHQFAKLYLFSPSSAVYSCPLAMTDGAARVIELAGTPEMKRDIYPHLISRDPKVFWTSGQWMTERPGGSDVGRTETVAELLDPETNTWSISGFKWFSSATTADITMLLARTVDPKTNQVKPGSRGLSLYFANMRQPNGQLNGVRVHRLKDKFGTKALPTAELELNGMKATLVGEIGRGVPTIASILNITRIYSTMGSASGLRRALAQAKDYARKRYAFNRTLDKTPLHITTLAKLELVYRANIQILFYATALLGRTECLPKDHPDHKLDAMTLRFITPIAKAYCCKIAINAISEAMEALGGQGYMEDAGLGRNYRDSQVNTVWEGTTNVLSMDVMRVLAETKGKAVDVFEKIITDKVEKAVPANKEAFSQVAAQIRHALVNIRVFTKTTINGAIPEASARDLTFAFGRVLAATLLLEQAAWAVTNNTPGAPQDVAIAIKWVQAPEFTQPIVPITASTIEEETKIVFGWNARM